LLVSITSSTLVRPWKFQTLLANNEENCLPSSTWALQSQIPPANWQQLAPKIGDPQGNRDNANKLLSHENLENVDLLVCPECVFTGKSVFYDLTSRRSDEQLGNNYKSLGDIHPFLEPTATGFTSIWARETALEYGCMVIAGYPEKVDVTAKWPASPEYHSSVIVVDAHGEIIANYRKSFVCSPDQKWALEGDGDFYDGEIEGLGNVVMGIGKCLTKNQYSNRKYQANILCYRHGLEVYF
jgi:protein N-terminal amidase